MPYKSKLPVITKEFGDTWIQGSASDPRKVAEMRAVFRARTKCLQSESGLCVIFDCFFAPYVIVQCSTLRCMYRYTYRYIIMICYNQECNKCDILPVPGTLLIECYGIHDCHVLCVYLIQ